jgi:hypothetical protein
MRSDVIARLNSLRLCSIAHLECSSSVSCLELVHYEVVINIACDVE